MKIIVTALRQEARPVIETLGLKQDSTSKRIPVYRSDNVLLVISGMGKLSAGIATTHAIHMAGQPEDCQIINVGACGAAVDQIALGEAVVIHKIWDHSSGREYFPDMLVKHPLKEASLGTFEAPVNSSSRPMLACDVVDMEASGIFQAARLYLPPHLLLFIKVATDYLDFTSDDYVVMQRYYEQSVGDWLPIIESLDGIEGTEKVISPEQEALLSHIEEVMRLTSTQGYQLREAVTRYLVRGGGDLEMLAHIVSKAPKHKVERNHMFASLIQKLGV